MVLVLGLAAALTGGHALAAAPAGADAGAEAPAEQAPQAPAQPKSKAKKPVHRPKDGARKAPAPAADKDEKAKPCEEVRPCPID
jgi:hypothetical protein